MIKDTIETWKELPSETKDNMKILSIVYGFGFITALLITSLF